MHEGDLLQGTLVHTLMGRSFIREVGHNQCRQSFSTYLHVSSTRPHPAFIPLKHCTQVEHAAKAESESWQAATGSPATRELLRLSLLYGIASSAAAFVAVQRRPDGSKMVRLHLCLEFCVVVVHVGAFSRHR